VFVGDTIVSVGDKPVNDPDGLFSVLHSDTVGKSVEVEVLRGGKPETLQVTVGERK
jgi:S1-C subfamily serine protease